MYKCSQSFLFTQRSMNISFKNTSYRRMLLDHVGTNIHDYLWTKTTFMDHVKQRRHFSLVDTTFCIPTVEDKGRLHATITKLRLIAAKEISLKHAWARLPLIEIDWDVATIDLAYLFTWLVTITQFCLVQRVLQGVEHIDPTEWSNSHHSIGDKFVVAVRQTASLFKGCSLFFFPR